MFLPLLHPPTRRRCRGRRDGCRFTYSLFPHVRAPPILMHSLLTAIWAWESQQRCPSIPVACPLGPEPARQPGSRQTSPLVSQAGTGLDGSHIQQGQKGARAASWKPFGWWLPHWSDWMQVYALPVLPKPALNPQVPVVGTPAGPSAL